tara:strand:+ start:811 stop:2763 length:1953 start_codon:yes stop_codon:yes gene_type:complete
MPDYINPNSFVVHLTGPNGETIKVSPYAKVRLSSYFDKYKSRGFIRDASMGADVSAVRPKQIRGRTSLNKRNPKINQPSMEVIQETAQVKQSNQRKQRRQQIAKARKIIKKSEPRRTPIKNIKGGKRQVVGRNINIDATELLHNNLKQINYPISNNIGIGILSYERPNALKNCVNSIIKHTDLQKTTIFISDDSSTNPELLKYLDELKTSNNFVVLKNTTRLGIAGNTNRLIRCLSRFKYGMLLNDDVEILHEKWEYFYAEALKATKMHHLIFQQDGLFGTNREGLKLSVVNGKRLLEVNDRPHGAVLAFTRQMLVKCGYFDESYGIYGMEHVDWSSKAYEMGLQLKGYYDVRGSEHYFKLHNEKSAVEEKGKHLRNAKKIFDARKPERKLPSEQSKVPEIAYVIPFRNIDRQKSIETVLNNIRAQKFPVVHIIAVEQDSKANYDVAESNPIIYELAGSDNPLFNKSMAFNLGVSRAICDKIILHDADMLAQSNYSQKISDILDSKSGCHIGARVLYADQASTDLINKKNTVGDQVKCERVVGYYEGGSLACTKKVYWKIGAFNEDFWGYGCEDCDFYARLASDAGWCGDRSVDLLHLWHSRTSGWNAHHDENKRIQASLNSLSMAERVKLQIRQLVRNGYERFLSKRIK